MGIVTMGKQRGQTLRRFKVLTVLATGLLLGGATFGQDNSVSSAPSQEQPNPKDKKAQAATAAAVKLRIQVTGNEKPISNASVYVRYNEPGGLFHHDKLAELSFKTSGDGLVKVPPVPQGKIMIQVIASGWHTYGKWYDIEKEEESVQIKLELPPRWY